MASDLARVIAGAKPAKKHGPHLTAKPDAKAPLGEGGRFAAVEKSAAKSGARDPAAVAAAMGKKAHGAAEMKRLAAKGKKG